MQDLALRCYNNIEVHDKYGRVVNRADKMDERDRRGVCALHVFQDLLRAVSLFKNTTISSPLVQPVISSGAYTLLELLMG